MPIVFTTVYRSISKAGHLNYRYVGIGIFIAVIVFAAILRIPRLSDRPMHCDEAVHAVKFGQLLEEADYRYDPFEYHGPTLNYFTLLAAWLSRQTRINDVSETTLRIVPVFFGLMLIVLYRLLKQGLARPVMLVAMLLAAVSPGLVFYSRYYIQEMLLVCFTFGAWVCGWRYVRKPNIGWAVGVGLFIGLMHATKETCVIAYAAMIAAAVLTGWIQRKHRSANKADRLPVKPLHLIAGLAVAVVVSAMFLSSFFRNPHGIWDSIFCYSTYVSRAGQNTLHIHPWHYYLKLLTFYRFADGPVFTEALILGFAAVGFVFAFKKNFITDVDPRLLRFIAFYTLILTAIYSALRYKTPWCAMNFLQPMTLLTAVGIYGVFQTLRRPAAGVILAMVIILGIGHLMIQSVLGNFVYDADSRNPYVYAHTGRDIFDMAKRVRSVAQFDNGTDSFIQIISPEHDYWPFPWYLRDFKHIAYSDQVDMNSPSASIIIASPKVRKDLMTKFYVIPPPGRRDLYMPLFDRDMFLRPMIPLDGYVKMELFEIVQQNQ